MTIEYSTIKRIYQKINHNLLRALLFKGLGDYLESIQNGKEQLDSYMKAFDAMRIENDAISILSEIFDKITPLMFKFALYEEFTALASAYIFELKSKNLSIPPNVLFNMSLAYSRDSDLLEAMDYIDQYLDCDYSEIDYPSGLLIKANLFSTSKRHEIAKDLYLQSSAMFLERGDLANHCLSLSNIIDILTYQGKMIKSESESQTIRDSIEFYIKDLNQKLSRWAINPIYTAKVFTNIAKGLAFLEMYDTAIEYFEKIFRIDSEQEEFTHFFRAINIAIPCFSQFGKLNYLYEEYVKYEDLPFTKWSKQLKKAYEDVLLKIGMSLIDSNDNILKEIFKSLIMIKDVEEQ